MTDLFAMSRFECIPRSMVKVTVRSTSAQLFLFPSSKVKLKQNDYKRKPNGIYTKFFLT